MKKSLLHAFIVLLLSITGTLSSVAGSDDPNSNYVVIGAFAAEDHALIWVEKAKKLHLNAEFNFNPTRNLYYVYVFRSGDRLEAITKATELRNESPFSDTWVYSGALGEDADIILARDLDPITEAEFAKEETEKVADVQPVLVEKSLLQDSSVTVSETPLEDPSKGKGFLFSIFNNEEKLKGEVTLINVDRLAKVASYEGNTWVFIKPVNKSGKIEFQCEVFGYRKAQADMDYNAPGATEGVQVENNNVIVPFEMVRVKKGDFSIMYNVFFFKDAAIMRPESKYEVNALKDMMDVNPNYKIKLHGHTNGGAAGKIIEMGDAKNFFSLSGSKEGFGSAKELSEERASIIREYLISEGIAADRIQVQAWGGKKPIHDKKSNKAHENIRVEVEILED